MQPIRIQKALSEAGVASRRAAEELVRQGRVTINGRKAEIGQSVNPDRDVIAVDGKRVYFARKKQYRYIMMNKPRGYVTTASDELGRKTVMELVSDIPARLYPVGRLDKDTVGLLLITNDGNLAHRLLSPKHHVDKCYFAKVQGNVTKDDAEKFAEGVNIGTEDEPEITMPGKLDIIKSDDLSEIRLTIQEGKFHQVKRMFQAVGKEVVYLKRERMGSLVLDDNLAEGEYRMLTEEELKNLLF